VVVPAALNTGDNTAPSFCQLIGAPYGAVVHPLDGPIGIPINSTAVVGYRVAGRADAGKASARRPRLPREK